MQAAFFLLFLLFAGSPLLASAQRIELDWERDYRFPNAVQLHDMQLLPDGRLAGVGVIEMPGKKKAGYFVLLDGMTGEIIQQKTYSAALDNALLGIAEADDASFYCVGYSETSEQDRQAWLLHLDEHGELIHQAFEGGKGDDEFTCLTWLNSNSTGIIVGKKAGMPDGDIWVQQVRGNRLTDRGAMGDGGAGQPVAVVSGASDKIWIAGNVRKKGIAYQQQGWVMLLNKNADALNTSQLTQDKSKIQSIADAGLTFNQNLLLAGELWYNGPEVGDAWFVRVDELSFNADKKVYELEGSEQATAICPMLYDSFLVAIKVQSYRSPASILAIFDRMGKKVDGLALSKGEELDIFRLIKNFDNSFLVIGNVRENKQEKAGFRIACIRNGIALASKGGLRLKLIGTPWLVEPQSDKPDGILSPGEQGSIHFKIKNDGLDDILLRGEVLATLLKPHNGLSILRPVQYMQPLLKGMEQEFTIGVRGAPNLAPGSAEMIFHVVINRDTVLSIPYTLKTSPDVLGSSTRINFTKPDIRNTGSRVVTSNDPNYRVEATVTTAKKGLGANDPVVVKNGLKLKDEKASRSITDGIQEGGAYEYNFYTDVLLTEGRNVVYIQLDDYKTDSIVIVYEPERPDLHVLSIGVPYPDLQYTSKDARDFAQAIGKQRDGFFREVFIDTLLSASTTDRQTIEAAFEDLLSRFLSKDDARRIKPYDYLMVFISSHGLIRSDGRFCLRPSNYNEAREKTTSIDYKQILDDFIGKIQCKRIVFVDACHSGAGKSGTDDALGEYLRRANSSAPGLTVFTSSSGQEKSYEYPTGENGMFTEALLEAISGQTVHLLDGQPLSISGKTSSDEQGGVMINIRELDVFLQRRIKDLLLSSQPHLQQTPGATTNGQNEDLPLFLIRKP